MGLSNYDRPRMERWTEGRRKGGEADEMRRVGGGEEAVGGGEGAFLTDHPGIRL